MKKFIMAMAIFGLWGYLLRLPVDGGTISSPYGPRLSKGSVFHSGTDIATPAGTGVFPVSWGTVKEAGFSNDRGNYVVVDHLLGFIESRYFHLSSVDVSQGQVVTVKSPIGKTGNTGNSSGAHLHFEIRFLGAPLPPYIICLPWLTLKYLKTRLVKSEAFVLEQKR